MADFQEPKLTNSLTDNASAGLTNIRTQLIQLTQTAGQVQTALTGVANSAKQVGKHTAAGDTARFQQAEGAQGAASSGRADHARHAADGPCIRRAWSRGVPRSWRSPRAKAWAGFRGGAVAMGELGVASQAMVISLGAVTLGVAAIGAAVVAYGVSVFEVFAGDVHAQSNRKIAGDDIRSTGKYDRTE